ncbi:MSCRAMM family protein [Anaeromyxobacter diazotrophicus]|uniref:NOMO second beta-sandwich domain-containing protein n=1 Tax=Anaeromyxobacter diazotrophicus TaxID=2590199 RepID=A0A7I9VQ63_9BACT|nr:carboxypeptidase-like regulatory domain-containing protein [Anaeromyxobacter diazotrophicus]GEJ58535.1 hypothetical protein AMYX_32760 [Anaeromyxobacter diazotrophicus]
MRRGLAWCFALLPLVAAAVDPAPAPPAPAPAPTFTLTGKVTGAVVAGVTIALPGAGVPSKVTVTDAAGNYAFDGLAAGAYKVTPALAGYVFAPASADVSVGGGAPGTAPDLVASALAPASYAVSGTISGAAKKDVAVTLTTGDGTKSTKSDANGAFSFAKLPPGAYTVAPSSKEYVFTPASTRIVVSREDVPGVDFVADKTEPHAISGTISGAVVSGITLTVSGSNSASATSSSSGRYEIRNLANGTYTVKPSADGYLFTPAAATVTVKDEDVPAMDFKAVATRCVPPVVTFRWIGTHGSFMTTNAKFAPVEPSTLERVASTRDARELPSIRILSKDRPLAEFKDVAYFRRCASGDANGCEEQVFRVDFENQDAQLLENGGRVQVEFTGLQDCSGRVRIEDVVVLEQHHLAIDVGAAFALDAAGSFASHVEAALNANSRWLSWLSGDVDLRLTKVEVLQTPPPGATQTSFLNTGGTTLDVAGRALLDLDGRSSFPFLAGAKESHQPWLAPVLGAGMRSLISGDKTDVRGRLFTGLRMQVLGYNAGEPAESFGNTRGFVEAGYANDQFWRGANQNRVYAEGQIEVPSFGSKWVRLLLRMKVDRGIGPPGDPSEVRISLLTSLNPSALGTFLGFAPAKK